MKGLKPIRRVLSLKQIGTICFAFLFSVFSTNLFATDPNIPANATSASCTNSTLNTYSGTSNLQANWEANQIGLYWYSDGNQITDIQSAATTCDYDGGLTVPSNPPTKTGYTFNGWKVRGLPEGYTRLQYLQFTGTQYINTGIKANNNTKAEGVFYINSGFNGHVFGSYNSGAYFRIYVPSGSITGTVFGGTSFTPSSIVPGDFARTTSIRIKLDNTGIYIGNKTFSYTSTPGSFTATSNMYLGAINAYSSNSKYLQGKVYTFNIVQNGTLVRNFIPAKNSSNVLGMYDTVSETFFTNAGSGTFTAGPVVQ